MARNIGIVVWAFTLLLIALNKADIAPVLLLLLILVMPVIVTLQLIASFQTRIGVARPGLNTVAGLQMLTLFGCFMLMPNAPSKNPLLALVVMLLGLAALGFALKMSRMVVRYVRPDEASEPERKQVKAKVSKPSR